MRDHLRGVFISMATGIAFSSVYALGRGSWSDIITSGAIAGLSIYIVIAVLEALFEPVQKRLPRRAEIAVHIVIFLIGGTFGWLAGVLIAMRVIGDPVSMGALFRGPGKTFMLITGALAVVVGLTIHSFESLTQRLRDREWAEKELELARAIQTRLLPPQKIDGDGFSIAARNIPAHVVAGDFYDFVPLDDGSIVIVVGDVAGKGMGASLIMASVKAVLPFVARGPIADAMATLNAKLVQELGRREFVALVCARYFPGDGTLHVANAGCPDPYVIGSDGVRPIAVDGERLPLGIRRDLTYTTTITRLAPGERLVLVTDGIPEAPARGDVLGYERLAAILAITQDADELIARVRAEVDEGIADDWTVVVLCASPR